MKLKEPLYGIKMVSGHIISHFAMFIIQSRINVSEKSGFNQPYSLYTDELKAFNVVLFIHLLTGILQMVIIHLKYLKYDVPAQVLSVITLFLYLWASLNV
jgi:hypothetical protein